MRPTVPQPHACGLRTPQGRLADNRTGSSGREDSHGPTGASHHRFDHSQCRWCCFREPAGVGTSYRGATAVHGSLSRSAGAPLGTQARRRQPAFAHPTTERTPGTGSVQPLSAAKWCACRPYPRLGQRGGIVGLLAGRMVAPTAGAAASLVVEAAAFVGQLGRLRMLEAAAPFGSSSLRQRRGPAGSGPVVR